MSCFLCSGSTIVCRLANGVPVAALTGMRAIATSYGGKPTKRERGKVACAPSRHALERKCVMSVLRSTLVLGLLGLLVACSHDRPARTATQARPPVVDQTTVTSAQMPKQGNTDVSGGVSVSNEILQACKLEMGNAGDAPKFPFDQTDLLDEDTKVLNQIADCLTTGPLKGRQVMLTGRADNRGTTEYNMTLGANRAHTVSQYLSSKGVDTMRMQETSRGELDATGTDVLGQKQDRRVDITLK